MLVASKADMRRFRESVVSLVVFSLVFVQVTGVYYLRCLDRQEPTTTVIVETYVASALFGGNLSIPADDTNSPADVIFDLSDGKAAAKVAQVVLDLVAILVFTAILLISNPRFQRLQIQRRRPAVYLCPPFFVRPPPRAPPL